MGTIIQILCLGVVHKLHTLVIQNMLTIGESRDMSRIYIALQGQSLFNRQGDITSMEISLPVLTFL